jgi:hypothetical protein
MPKITCKVQGAIITRDRPDLPFNPIMGTRYSVPKEFAFLGRVGQTGPGLTQTPESSYHPSRAQAANGWMLLKFASPIPIGNKSVDQGWVKSSDWEFGLV